MSLSQKRILWPLGAGLTAALLLTTLYLGILSIVESPQHAFDQFSEDRWIIGPIIIGFGVQAALYITLKKQLFVPVTIPGHSGRLMGVGGATSTLTMVACCAHHVTDALPVLGITAASAFLAQYRTVFMLIGLAMNLVGIVVMSIQLFKARRKAIYQLSSAMEGV